MKTCSVCGIEKSIDDFKPTGLQCKPCVKLWHAKNYQRTKEKHAERYKKFRRENPEKCYVYDLRSRLKTKYGITLDHYTSMLASQNNSCAICKSKDPKRKNAIGFFVDHNHKTDKVRGLLCHRCNLAVGWMEDNLILVDSVKAYIEKD